MSSQPLEMHRDCALSGRLQAAACHNTTHKETQARALLCQAGLLPALHKSHQHPEPVTAVGQGSQGCLTPCQATAEAALAHSQDQSPQLL